MNNEDIKIWLGDDKKNPMKLIQDKLEEAGLYAENEIGLYHPITNAIIKLRNNGMIDIFSGRNGIRIDQKTYSINFFCNNEKHHVGNIDMWIEEQFNINTKKININCEDEQINIGSLNIKHLIDEKNSIIEEIKNLKQAVKEIKESL